MRGYASFNMFCVKIRAGALAVGDYMVQKTKKIVEPWCTNSRDW